MTLLIFIWSCASSWQDLKGVRIYYRLKVQLEYLVDFAQFLLWLAPHFTFVHSKLQPYTLWNHFFKNKFEFFFLYLVLYLQLVGSQEDQKRLPTRGAASILSQLCPIFNEVCSFYFCNPNQSCILVYNLQLVGSQDAQKILEVQLAYLIDQYFLQSALHFTLGILFQSYTTLESFFSSRISSFSQLCTWYCLFDSTTHKLQA